MELCSSNDSDETIGCVGSAGSRTDLPRRRFSSASLSPNAFLTPAFTAAAGTGGSSSSLNIEPSLLHSTQSRMSRLKFSSSSSSSNEPPDSNSSSTAAMAARKRLQQLFKLRSFSYSSLRGSTQSPLSPIENLQALPLSARSSSPYSVYKNPVNMEVEEDVLVMDALGDSVPLMCRSRKSLELLSSFSSPSSVNNSHFDAKLLKTEICRSWEEYGLCRFGTRCQFAHGKEELRGTPGPSKLKSESAKELSTVGSGDYRNKKPRPFPALLMDSALLSSEAPSSSSSDALEVIIRQTGTENMTGIGVVAQHLPVQQLNPMFSWPPTEDEEAEIKWVLYGPGRRRSRLPVFQYICTDSNK